MWLYLPVLEEVSPHCYGLRFHRTCPLSCASVQRPAHQLRALKPAPTLTYVPLSATGGQSPGGAGGFPTRRLHARVRPHATGC